MKPIFKKSDYYSRLAKQEKYPARSVYKLEQINMKYNVIRRGDKVIDLGCAPGSWLLYISKKIEDKGVVVGTDIVDLKIEIPKNAEFIKSNIMNFNIDGKFDVVVSDLAPNTSGIHFVDTGKSLEYCERAFEIAKINLKKGGNFVCKIFEGEGTDDFFKKAKNKFAFAKRYKPKASRKESREIYIVGKGFRYE